MKDLWFAIIFSVICLLLLHVIKLIGISLNCLLFFRFGHLYMESEPMSGDYESILSLVKGSGMGQIQECDATQNKKNVAS